VDKPAATTKKPAAKRAPRARKPVAPRPAPIRLAEDDIVRARATAPKWDRASKFNVSEYFVHAKFGVGYVTGFTEQNFIVCLFEDGDTRKLVHGNSLTSA
jgi:hypothetical protein